MWWWHARALHVFFTNETVFNFLLLLKVFFCSLGPSSRNLFVRVDIILWCWGGMDGGGDWGLKITRKAKKNSKSRRRNCVHYNIFHLSQPHSSFRASRSLTTVSSAMHNMLILFVTDKLHSVCAYCFILFQISNCNAEIYAHYKNWIKKEFEEGENFEIRCWEIKP